MYVVDEEPDEEDPTPRFDEDHMPGPSGVVAPRADADEAAVLIPNEADEDVQLPGTAVLQVPPSPPPEIGRGGDTI